jgi:hypothetical protein
MPRCFNNACRVILNNTEPSHKPLQQRMKTEADKCARMRVCFQHPCVGQLLWSPLSTSACWPVPLVFSASLCWRVTARLTQHEALAILVDFSPASVGQPGGLLNNKCWQPLWALTSYCVGQLRELSTATTTLKVSRGPLAKNLVKRAPARTPNQITLAPQIKEGGQPPNVQAARNANAYRTPEQQAQT